MEQSAMVSSVNFVKSLVGFTGLSGPRRAHFSTNYEAIHAYLISFSVLPKRWADYRKIQSNDGCSRQQ